MTPTPTLDFADIRKSCPNAFAALEKHLRYDWVIAPSGQLGYLYDEGVESPVAMQYNPRDLFDFFDANGVYVLIEHNGTAEQPFAFEIETSGEMYWPGNYYPTRAAAEADAFTAGFEKLEEMLGKEEGR